MGIPTFLLVATDILGLDRQFCFMIQVKAVTVTILFIDSQVEGQRDAPVLCSNRAVYSAVIP